MIGLVSLFLHGFQVNGLLGGVVAAIITGATSWIGHMVVGRR